MNAPLSPRKRGSTAAKKPTKPLPCPFCGQSPSIQLSGPQAQIRCVEVECAVEPIGYWHPTRAEAIAAWNRRAS